MSLALSIFLSLADHDTVTRHNLRFLCVACGQLIVKNTEIPFNYRFRFFYDHLFVVAYYQLWSTHAGLKIIIIFDQFIAFKVGMLMVDLSKR
jgi:hypothetical protein